MRNPVNSNGGLYEAPNTKNKSENVSETVLKGSKQDESNTLYRSTSEFVTLFSYGRDLQATKIAGELQFESSECCWKELNGWGQSIGASRASENENERGNLRTHKIEGGNCGGVGREAWSAIRIIQRKRGLLEYEGDVRRRPGGRALCARWGTRVVSSSTSSSINFSSGRCGFPFSAQEVEVSFGGPWVASIFKFIVQVLVQTLLVTR